MATAEQCATYHREPPAEHPLSDTCRDLETALAASLQGAGFDVDGVEVEPDGQHEVLVCVHPFPAIGMVAKSLPEMVREWADEASYLLLGVK